MTTTLQNLPLAVTGVSSGIGAATAQLLASAGRPLIGIDRTVPEVFDAPFVQADLSTPEGARTAAATVAEIAGPAGLAGLANIAGVPGTAPWRTVLAVNVFGVRELTRSLASALVPGAAVVNLASSVAFQWRDVAAQAAQFALAEDMEVALDAVATDEQATGESYLFSKHCVRFLTEALASELLPRRVRVNSVSPGPVQTPILEDFKTDHGRDKVEGAASLLGRFGQPEDIARVVGFLLSEDAGWINGADLRVDGGLIAHRTTGSLLTAP